MASLESTPGNTASNQEQHDPFKERMTYQRLLMQRAAGQEKDHARIAELWFEKGYSELFAQLADMNAVDLSDTNDDALDSALKQMEALRVIH